MSSVIEPQFRERPVPVPPRNAAQILRETDVQNALLQTPEALGMISRQLAGMRKLLLDEAERRMASANQSQVEHEHQSGWVERLHDRMDALLIESRVANELLAQLVAIQRSVIPTDTTTDERQIKDAAYHRVLNGE